MIVLVRPMHASYGINFKRSLMDIFATPPVAWKKEPCGRESITVAPAWIIAPEDNAGTPAAVNVDENVCAAIVEPAVVDAVAPAIKIPESGARMNAGMFIAVNALIMSYCKLEALMIPAIVPVPINKMDTPITLLMP